MPSPPAKLNPSEPSSSSSFNFKTKFINSSKFFARGAITIIVALAWNELFKNLSARIDPDGVWGQVAHTLVITLIAVVVAFFLRDAKPL